MKKLIYYDGSNQVTPKIRKNCVFLVTKFIKGEDEITTMFSSDRLREIAEYLDLKEVRK